MAIANPPRLLLPHLHRFPANRDTQGGTAYFLQTPGGNVLIDSPPLSPDTLQWIGDQGPVVGIYLTHRDNHGSHLVLLQKTLQCPIWVQEQEAYLLPGLEVRTFGDALTVGMLEGIWTPGYSPGSTCYYWLEAGGILFTGRHIIPHRDGHLCPKKWAKTFHWPRQLASVQKLQTFLADKPLAGLCPGENGGLYEPSLFNPESFADAKSNPSA